jgi:ACDE family multidrug resistance protein
MANKLFKDRRIFAIFGVTIVAVMGVASISPALPTIAESLDLSKGQIALLISVFTFPGIILTPISGILADRVGRKRILIPALFVFALAGSAIFFVHDFHTILVFRVLQGIGAAPLGALNATLIGDYYKGRQLPEAMGYNASVLSLSTASYPLIGGGLAAIAWYYPFLLPLLAIPLGIFAIFGLKEPEIEKQRSFKKYLKDIGINIVRGEVIAVFVLGTLTFIILYGAFLTYMPFLLKENFGFSPRQIGLFTSMSSISTALVSLWVGRLSKNFGSLNLLKTAFILYMIVTAAMPFVGNMYVFILPIIVFGTAQALNIPSLQTIMARLAPDKQRGAFMSLNGMVIRVGQTLGPMIIGIGYAIGGLSGAFYLAAFVGLVGVLITMFFIKEKVVN